MDVHASTLFIGQFPVLLGNLSLQHSILLYLGPETIMPVGSFLAAALGFVLIFWRHTMTIARNSFKRVFVRRTESFDAGREINVNDPGQDRTPDNAN